MQATSILIESERWVRRTSLLGPMKIAREERDRRKFASPRSKCANNGSRKIAKQMNPGRETSDPPAPPSITATNPNSVYTELESILAKILLPM